MFIKFKKFHSHQDIRFRGQWPKYEMRYYQGQVGGMAGTK